MISDTPFHALTDVMDMLPDDNLAERAALLKMLMDRLELDYKATRMDLLAEMVAQGQKKIEAEDYSVTVEDGRTTTKLNKEKLLTLGVAPQIIEQATEKTTSNPTVRVTTRKS